MNAGGEAPAYAGRRQVAYMFDTSPVESPRSVDVTVKHTLMLAVLVKAFIMGVIASIIDLTFVKSLILIVVSACITGAFALVVAWLQIRANREMHDRIDRIEGRQISVAKQAGADPRWPPRDEEEAK